MKIRAVDETNGWNQQIACYVSGVDANPKRIYDGLWDYENGYFQGTKLVMVFDLLGDEYKDPQRETAIYYMDSVGDEVMEYIGERDVIRWLENRGYDVVKERK